MLCTVSKFNKFLVGFVSKKVSNKAKRDLVALPEFE